MTEKNYTCTKILQLLTTYMFSVNPAHRLRLSKPDAIQPCPQCIVCRSKANRRKSLIGWLTSKPHLDFADNKPYPDCYNGRPGLDMFKLPQENHCLEIGDGVCQEGRNTAACGWDGGDCNGWEDAAVCLQLGDTVLFDLYDGNKAYPVYVKDSLLNTNKGFDYSAFTTLKADALGKRIKDRVFAFTFRENGTYVFAHSTDLTKQTVVTVKAAGSVCAVRLAPKTKDSLIGLKARDQAAVALKLVERAFHERASKSLTELTWSSSTTIYSDIATYIDMVTLSIIIVLLILLILLILFGLYNRHLHTKRRRERTKEAREMLIEQNADLIHHEIAIDTVTEQELIAQTQHETTMQVAKVMQEMTGHTKHSKQSFKDIHSDFQEILDNMKKENDGLRQLLAATLLKNGGSEQIEKALRTQIETDIASRTIHSGRFESVLAKVIKVLYTMDEVVKNNPKRASKDILFELSKTDDKGLHSADVSEKLTVILDGILDVGEGVKELTKLKESESKRGEVADAMYGAARYTNILNPDSALSRSLQMMAESVKAVDESREELTAELDKFVKAAEETTKTVGEARPEFKEGYAKALEMHNPVETKNVQRALYTKILPPITGLAVALKKLLRMWPQTERQSIELLPQARDSQERVQHELDLRAMRLHKGIEEDLIEDEEGKKRMTARQLRQRKGTMIELDIGDDDLDDFDQLELEFDNEELALEAETRLELDKLFDDDEEVKDISLLDLNLDDDDLDGMDLDDMVRKQLMEQHALQQEAIEKALAEERAKAEANVRERLNVRKKNRRKKNHDNEADEAEEAALLKKFEDEFTELDLQQQLELDALENDLDADLDMDSGLGDPELQAALEDLDKDFEFNLNGIQDEQFKEMATKLGHDENILMAKMDEFKMMLESDRMEEEDKLEREFNANKQILEADLQKAIAEGDDAAKQKAELEIQQLQEVMEREQMALAADFDTELAKKMKETKASLVEEFEQELMKTQDGLEMLEEQKFEISELREQLITDKQQATHKIAAKHGGVEALKEKSKEAKIETLKQKHAEQREKFETKKKGALREVQNRLENAEDEWHWEDELEGKIKAKKESQDDSGATATLKTEAKLLSLAQMKEKGKLETMLESEMAKEMSLIEGMTLDTPSDEEAEPKYDADGNLLDEDAAAKVRKKFNQSERDRKRALQAKKLKKKALLKQRLEEKRRALRDKQREEIKAKQQLVDEAVRMETFDMEMVAIKGLLAEGKISEEQVGEAIEKALNERHRKESAGLCADHFQEKQLRLQDALQDLQHETQMARIELMATFDENTTPAQRKQALAELDIKFEVDLGRRRQIVLSEFESMHQQMDLMQRTRQTDEITEGYKRLASEEVFRGYLLKQAKKQREEMNAFKAKMEQQKRDKIEKLRREAEERTRMLEARTAADLSRLEVEHQEKLDAERRRAFEALTKKKDKMMSIQEQQYRADLAAARGMPEAQLKLLKNKFEQDKRRVNRMLVSEKRRQEAQLQDLLDKRKARMYKRRQEEARRKIEESEAAAANAIKELEKKTEATLQMAKNLDEESTNKIRNDLTQTRTLSLNFVSKMSVWARKAKKARKAKLDAMSPEARREQRLKAKDEREAKVQAKLEEAKAKEPAEAKEEAKAPETKQTEQKEPEPADRAARLEAARQARADKEKEEAEKEEEFKLDVTEMLARMDNVWQLLSEYGNSNSPYRDPQDQAKANEGTLEVTKRELLDKASEKGLQFAERIAESMGFGPASTATGFTAIAILPAAKLEKNAYHGNAYRNSIQYEPAKKTLYLRAAILADLSQVALVATHTFAHLSIDADGSSLARDNDPEFQQLYLSSLQHSYQLMFLENTTPTSKPSAEGADAASAAAATSESKLAAGPQGARQKQTRVALARRLQEYGAAVKQHDDWQAERLKSTGPALRISPEQVHEQTVSSLRDGIDASVQDVIHSALTMRANCEILEKLKDNLKVAAKSGDHMLWKMIKGKVDKAEMRTEMANIQTRKASIVSDTFVLALKRVS